MYYICDYGCGKQGRYYFKNSKKWCCESHYTKCPSIRLIRSKIRKNAILNDEIKEKIRKSNLGKSRKVNYIKNKNKLKICDYGCGQYALYYFTKIKKYCCSKTWQSCPKIRNDNRNREIERCKNKEYRKYKSYSLKGKKNSKSIKIENIDNKLCSYGCKKLALFYFPTVNKYCCSESISKCSEKSKIISKKQKESWKNKNSGHNSKERSKKRSIFLKEFWKSNDCPYNSDEYKENQRNNTLKRIKNNKGQIVPFYNPIGCKIIENLNKIGYNFKHAENGGEYQILGYFLDGYDVEKNIAIEIDECYHNNEKVRERDIKREKEITKKIGCLFIRIKIDKQGEIIDINNNEFKKILKNK